MSTVAEILVESLVKTGVKRMYGMVGDSLNGVTDALRRKKSIQWIHVRHEEVAAFAAGADAHVTGELAVCAGSCGPGNLHLINGLFDCHRSGVPVLAIAAQIPTAEIGSGYFQETHPESLFQECSSYCQLISTPAQMPRAVETAIAHAIGRRGVAVIVLPGDVALQATEYSSNHGLQTGCGPQKSQFRKDGRSDRYPGRARRGPGRIGAGSRTCASASRSGAARRADQSPRARDAAKDHLGRSLWIQPVHTQGGTQRTRQRGGRVSQNQSIQVIPAVFEQLDFSRRGLSQ
jgi:hypothetical protein